MGKTHRETMGKWWFFMVIDWDIELIQGLCAPVFAKSRSVGAQNFTSISDLLVQQISLQFPYGLWLIYLYKHMVYLWIIYG